MKRSLLGLLAVIFLLCLAACGGNTGETDMEYQLPANITTFSDENALISHMSGIWTAGVLDGDNEYYIFRDGQVLYSSDRHYKGQAQDLVDFTIENKGVEACAQLTAEDVGQKMNPLRFSSVRIVPQEGTVIVDDKYIFVTQSDVFITDSFGDEKVQLTKVSDKVDFAHAHFKALFEQTLAETTVPSTSFLCSTEKLEDYFRAVRPELSNWKLADIKDGAYIYTNTGSASSYTGYFEISEKSLTFMSGSVKVGSTNLAKESVIYAPYGNSYTICATSRSATMDVKYLAAYATKVTEQYPGALDKWELYDLYKQKKQGGSTFNETVNGINYMVMEKADGKETNLYITVPKELKLSDAIKDLSNAYHSTSAPSDFTEPTEKEDTEPEQTEPTQTKPMNDVPYTTTLDGDAPIYSKPDSNSSSSRTVGKSGVYTIVEEAYDDEGNLWGKLKSGLGWVML